MTAKLSPKHRLRLAAFVAITILLLLYTAYPFNLRRFESVIPIRSGSSLAKPKRPAKPPSQSNDEEKDPNTSRFHLLVPASQSNLHFCYQLASAAVNRYPVPTLLGWKGRDEFDAGMTHLAKLRAIKRYLYSFGDEDEDDLVMIVDGYDIIHQLPPQVVIERYFQIAEDANARLAARLGISLNDASARNIKQSVFFGPDKVCWPPDPRAARCWAAPASTLDLDAFGPMRADNFFTADPRWLNSGTLIGPLEDVRRVVDATMEEIGATYDEGFWQSDSDQYYLSNVWGRQEYWRTKLQSGRGDEVLGGPMDRILPEKSAGSQETELHMAIEYESALFQTNAGNEPFIGHVQYDLEDSSANMTTDMFGRGDAFEPYTIEMPDNVRTALMRLYGSIAHLHPGAAPAERWVRMIHLGTNFVTKHIYGLWHCTGPKEFLDAEYTRMWFYPFVKSLLRESVRTSHRGETALSSEPIDGRKWVSSGTYPKMHQGGDDEYGGAWSDEGPSIFVPWTEMCGEHEHVLFWGQNTVGMR